MTHPSLSWTSRAEVARLLPLLTAPVGVAAPSPPPAALPVAQVAAAAETPPALPELTFPSSQLFDRVRLYCEWAQRAFAASSVFLSDEHGLMVHGVSAEPTYVAVMAPLLFAMQQVRTTLGADASRGAVAVRAGEVLNFAETVTRHGRYCVGLLHSDFLGEERLERLQIELARTLEEPQYA